MKISFDKTFYSREALIKAAYAFTDRAYLHLQQDENHFIIDFVPKNTCIETAEILCDKLKNELLAQSVRQVVYKQTKNIRELILARSLASTIIGVPLEQKILQNNDAIDKILTDWFENDEK